MKNGIKIIVALALLLGSLSIAHAVGAASANTLPRVIECHGMPAMFKPTIFTLECGDGNTVIRNITWSSWTSKSAKGSGNFWVNLCKPSCVYGKFVRDGVVTILLGKVRDSGSLGYEPLYTSTVVWVEIWTNQNPTS
jgi:hypothetical protein